jgi:hypothetical protein
VIYPSQSPAYNNSFPVPKDIVNQVVNDNKALIFQGCFAYGTANKVGHSAWCYYYRAGVSLKEHLSICGLGNYAD